MTHFSISNLSFKNVSEQQLQPSREKSPHKRSLEAEISSSSLANSHISGLEMYLFDTIVMIQRVWLWIPIVYGGFKLGIGCDEVLFFFFGL